MPRAHFGPIKVPEGTPDERGSVTVLGLGPIGRMSRRIARRRGARVIDWVPLQDAPQGYDMFQKKMDSAIKALLQP